MKNYSIFSSLAGLASLVGSCAISGLTLMIVVAGTLVPGLRLPFSYYEALNLPALSVLLPVAGMLVLAPFTFYLAFKRETPATTNEITEVAKPVTKEEKPEDHFLKAA